MKKFLLCLALLMASISASAQMSSQAFVHVFYTTLSAPGLTESFGVGYPKPPDNYTVTLSITGSPATCTFAFEGGIVPGLAVTNYSNLSGDIDCSTTSPNYNNGYLTFHVADKLVLSIQGHVKALSSGTVQMTVVGASK